MGYRATLKMIIAVFIFSFVLMTAFDKYIFTIKGMQFQTNLIIYNRGITEIIIPPIGKISATTHLMPLKLEITLQNIDIDILQGVIKQNPTSAEIISETRTELSRILLTYLIRLVILAVLGGIIGAIIISGYHLKPVLSGVVGGLAVSALVLGLTYATYDLERLRTPEYHGALKAAPWAIELAGNAFQKVHLLSEQMTVIAKNLYTIFEKIDEINPFNEDGNGLLVLHVSDIHNNPAAHEFLLQITKSFPIDLVIDTGDISDYGTPVESSLLTGLMDLQIPYLFIPGNHDSPEIMKALNRYPQVQVLTAGITDVQGLRILSMADPAAYTNQITTLDNDIVLKTREKLVQLWQESTVKPQIIAVHNFNLAETLVGKVPLILHGHNHQLNISLENGTIIVNAGTTGGAGIRGLQATKEIPYSVVLLHFTRDANNEWVLGATDAIKLFNFEKGFTLERRIFSKDERKLVNE